MIARTWTGRVRTADAAEYAGYIRETGFAEYGETPGNRGAWLMHRDVVEGVELVALTLWESRDAIRAFGGADITRARVEPEAQTLFIRFDETVSLYELDLRIDRPA